MRKCVDCDKEIPQARLELKPDSIRCVPCQSKYDVKVKATLKPDPNGPYPRGW